MRACIPSQEPSQAASHPAGPMCQGPVEVLGAACHVLNIIKPSMLERKFDIIWPIPICYDCYDHADFDVAMVMESCLPPCYVNASVMQCIHVVSHARFLCTARPRNASCQRCHYTSPAESIQRKTELLALKWAKRCQKVSSVPRQNQIVSKGFCHVLKEYPEGDRSIWAHRVIYNESSLTWGPTRIEIGIFRQRLCCNLGPNYKVNWMQRRLNISTSDAICNMNQMSLQGSLRWRVYHNSRLIWATDGGGVYVG